MQRRIGWQLIASGAIVLIALAAWALTAREPAKEPLVGPRVQFRREDEELATFLVELATTPQDQVRGLMEREHLPEGNGMLFIYVPPRIAGMWMKNMLISLDFLFIDERGVVVHTVENVPPCPDEGVCPTIAPNEPVKYVLEVPAGTIERYGLQNGDVMRTFIDV